MPARRNLHEAGSIERNDNPVERRFSKSPVVIWAKKWLDNVCQIVSPIRGNVLGNMPTIAHLT